MLKLIYNYKNNPLYRRSFFELAKKTFGIEFENWFNRGFWNENYISYSFLDADKVVANVSVNKMNLVLEGNRKNALQIGTVMTHPDYQKRGISKELMNIVLNEYEKEYDFIYLFPNQSALDYYPRFGFKSIEQSSFSININEIKSTKGEGRSLDVFKDKDIGIIRKLNTERRPISNIFGIENAEHILFFYTYNGFDKYFYYLEQENIIVIYSQENDIIHIYDVITKGEIDFYELLNKIRLNNAKKVVFHFTPDLLNIEVEPDKIGDEDVLQIKSASAFINKSFKYPKIAQA